MSSRVIDLLLYLVGLVHSKPEHIFSFEIDGKKVTTLFLDINCLLITNFDVLNLPHGLV